MARRARRRSHSARWGSWALAGAFHFGTKDIGWKLETDAERVRHGSPLGPVPPFKDPINATGVPLPDGRPSGEFIDVLFGRRTWRVFGTRPVSLKKLATLLRLTFGVQMEGETMNGTRIVFKTSPSPGARHPIEAYVYARHVEGLPRGLYHYSPGRDELHLIKAGASRAQLARYLNGQWWFEGAAAVVFMTAVLPRLWARYGHPRAYRSLLLGAGHLCQTFCLVATWLKLAPFCTQALDDSRIERDLKVDGETEILVYAAGVGSRPKGGRWVQWPNERGRRR